MALNRPHTQEEKDRISLAMQGGNSTSFKKGHIMPKKVRRKISLSQKSKIVSLETKVKMSNSKKGIKFSEKHKKNLSQSHKGYQMPLLQRQAIGKSLIGKRVGIKNPNWKGGITPINKKIRQSVEYRLWRESVFKRDSYTCIWCGFKGYIEADHIKSFAYFPELRFAIDNGRTLCLPCHKTTNTYLKNKLIYES